MKQSTVILSRDSSWGSRYFIFKELSRLVPVNNSAKIIHFLCTSSEVKNYLQDGEGQSDYEGYCFYILGDFVFDLENWLVIFELTKGTPVHFFVLSEPQKRHFLNITLFKEEMVSVIDPLVSQVKSEVHNFSWREFQQCHFKEIKLLYSGRLSFQKNIDDVLDIIEVINNQYDFRVELTIVGGFDEIGLSLQGQFFSENAYQRKLTKRIEKFDWVNYLGEKTPVELVKIIQDSDAFISLSTYHDEDYSLALNEAKQCGLPALITSWGGFLRFKNYEGNIFVPVEMGRGRYIPSKKDALVGLLKLITQLEKFERKKISEEYFKLKHNSEEELSKSYRDISQKMMPYKSLEAISRAIDDFEHLRKINIDDPRYRELYQKYYSDYSNPQK